MSALEVYYKVVFFFHEVTNQDEARCKGQRREMVFNCGVVVQINGEKKERNGNSFFRDEG